MPFSKWFITCQKTDVLHVETFKSIWKCERSKKKEEEETQAKKIHNTHTYS